jgi:hypothetical protein
VPGASWSLRTKIRLAPLEWVVAATKFKV